MITWVLTEEPDAAVAKAIEIVEARLGSNTDDVMWLCPAEVPEPEPIQD